MSKKPIQILLTSALFTFLLMIVLVLLTPAERTLGAKVRLVYFHGAWVWAGMIAFGAAALAGLAGLGLWLRRRPQAAPWQALSRSLEYAGLFFWLTYLPMSLVVMQVTWGGIYTDEPRFRVPLIFAVVGILLQAGLWLIDRLPLTGAANAVFGVTLLLSLRMTENVMHPDSPVAQADSLPIQVFFYLLVAVAIALAGQLTALHFLWSRPRTP